MKLVDILARELTEWAGDVGAITQDKLTGELLDYYHCPLRGGNEREVSSIADDAGEAHEGASGAAVTRAEWQAAVDALNAQKVVEWDGVGSPPAGSTCQIRHSGWDAGSWKTADIKYISSEYLIIRHGNFKREQHFHMPDIQFRPILTAEQVAAEERERAIDELVELFINHYEYPKGAEQYLSICTAIHDAGYRKQAAK